MPQAGPTAYEDLNGVLAQLVAGVRTILGDDLCGVYLQGSFALGDADVHRDVDFVIVVDREVSGRQETELQALQHRGRPRDAPRARRRHPRTQPVSAEDQTLAFLDYVRSEARQTAGTRRE